MLWGTRTYGLDMGLLKTIYPFCSSRDEGSFKGLQHHHSSQMRGLGALGEDAGAGTAGVEVDGVELAAKVRARRPVTLQSSPVKSPRVA